VDLKAGEQLAAWQKARQASCQQLVNHPVAVQGIYSFYAFVENVKHTKCQCFRQVKGVNQ